MIYANLALMNLHRRLARYSSYLLPCLLASLLAQSAWGLNVGRLSLEDCVLLGMRNNPDLINKELDRVTEKYTLALAYNKFEPQFTLGSGSSYNWTQADGVGSETHSTNIDSKAELTTPYGTKFTSSLNSDYSHNLTPRLSFSVVQPLLQGFGPSIAAADLYDAIDQEKLNRMGMRDQVISTIDGIITAYRTVISNELTLDSQQQQLSSSGQDLKNTELKIKAGTVAASTRIQAQSQIARQRLSLIQSKNTLEQNKRALLELIGLNSTTTYSVDNTINMPHYNLPSLKTCITMALDFDTSYQTLIINRAKLNRALLKAEDANRFKLDLTASTNHGVSGGSTDGNSGFAGVFDGYNHDQEVKLDLTVPLNKLELHSAIVSAKISIQQNEINIQQQKREIETKITNAYHQITNDLASTKLAQQAETLQKTVLEQAIKQVNLGRISQFEVNTERQNLLDSQKDYITAKIDYLNAITDLESQIGTTLKTWHIKVNY